MKNSLRALICRALLLSAAAFALPACRSNAEAVCDARGDCEGWRPNQFDDCGYHAEDEELDADRRGCLDYYDELQSCEWDTGRCNGAHWDTNCGPEHDRFHHCMD
jgi:hypothetical protein